MGCLSKLELREEHRLTSKVGAGVPFEGISANRRQPRTNTYWHPAKLLQDDEDEVP